MDIRAATVQEYAAAAVQLFGTVAAANALLDAIASGRFEPRGLLVAVDADEIRGAVLAEALPGTLAVIVPPKADNPATADALVAVALEYLQGCGSSVVQAYLDPGTDPASFERNGFLLVTSMEHRIWNGADILSFHDPILHFERDADETRLGQTILATYEGTLDAPEVLILEEPSTILAGYRHGNASPTAWLVSQHAKPVGALIVSEDGEIQYLGVVPEARGQGIGTALLHHALDHFRRRGIASVHATVDSRNRPACRMYERAGLTIQRTRQLWIRTFEGTVKTA